ncbi:hypothetical protein VEL84_003582 [Cronobacter sakazakii]|uniref:hypothetical protein n=1 Tax=Cronobacter sakazakii TaxID=28141 RepID=UPI000A163622|nr:hypothetical protein [Cronobacter sakazakii]EGZ6860458.1 hypothetical protein [Cronobacter sakazakii]EMC4329408.1 hypothetical protein [Cronobacter sakazakii]KAB0846614.1 hypothetical protein FZI10_20365 [Cronobacter sakazakii]PUV92437.1 hypothetical protein B7T06_19895 [Cronobacter sakazakii]
MSNLANILLLIVSVSFLLDCLFTGAIRKALAPVNGTVVKMLAIMLAFDSALDVISGVAA